MKKQIRRYIFDFLGFYALSPITFMTNTPFGGKAINSTLDINNKNILMVNTLKEARKLKKLYKELQSYKITAVITTNESLVDKIVAACT
jgi:hypothetical protein